MSTRSNLSSKITQESLQDIITWIVNNDFVNRTLWNLLGYNPRSVLKGAPVAEPREFTIDEYHMALKKIGADSMPDILREVVFDGAALRPLRPIEELRDLGQRGPHYLLMKGLDETAYQSVPEADIESKLSDWLKTASRHQNVWIDMLEDLEGDHSEGVINWAQFEDVLDCAKERPAELPPYLAKILFGAEDHRPKLKSPLKLQAFWRENKGNWARLLLNCFYSAAETRRMDNDYRNHVTKEQRLTLSNSFKAPRKGTALEKFISSLAGYDLHYDMESHYGKTIAFAQSSGAGKSKMMHDLRSRLPSITLCFRHSSDPTDGWPPPDEPIQDFLLDQKRRLRQKAEVRAAAFLGAVMDYIHQALQRSNTPSLSVINDLFEMDTPTEPWDSQRHRALVTIAEMATSSLRVPDGTFLQVPTDDDNATEWYIDLYKHFCLSPAIGLSQMLKSINHQWMVIGFDECSCLNDFADERPPQPSEEMSILALQRIIKAADSFTTEMPGFSFWYTLLDTNASIFDLVPPKGDLAPSARLASTLDPVAAWCYFGYDVMVDRNSPSASPSDSCTIKRLQTMGRPLWATENVHTGVLAAERKLIRGLILNPANKNHVLAIFSQRICLELATGEAASRFAEEGVRSHMRILRGLVERSMVFTRTPSEPMLAIAAANLLNKNVTAYTQAVETLVVQLVIQNSVINRGDLGELFARLTLTIARDWATCNHDLPTQHRRFLANGAGAPRVQMVTLWEFLVSLLGDKPKLRPLKTYAQRVWINFTHFHHLRHRITNVTPAYLRNAWERGAAFQGQHGQVSIDGLIVTYDGVPDAAWVDSKLGLLGFQVKFRAAAMPTDDRKGLENPTVDKKPQTHDIILLMDLGTDASHRGEVDDNHILVEVTKHNGRTRSCISVRGHLTSYPCLNSFSPSIHRSLIDPRVTIPPHLSQELRDHDIALDTGFEP